SAEWCSAPPEPIADLDPRGVVRVVTLVLRDDAAGGRGARLVDEAERVRVERLQHVVRLRVAGDRDQLVHPAPARPPELVEADEARAVLATRDQTGGSLGGQRPCGLRSGSGRGITCSSFHFRSPGLPR